MRYTSRGLKRRRCTDKKQAKVICRHLSARRLSELTISAASAWMA